MALSLGVLVADPAMISAALELLREAGSDARVFLMDEGVRAAEDARLLALLDEGVDISLCARDAEARGLAPHDGGARFGSQYDHATMVRDAARLVAMTGARGIDDRVAPTGQGRRVVAVRLTRDARHAKTAQALRSAVGYAACDLGVTVVVEPPARALLRHDDHPPEILRAMATLRGLGHSFVPPPAQGDLEVTW